MVAPHRIRPLLACRADARQFIGLRHEFELAGERRPRKRGPMSAPFNARRHRRRPSINITSLIDVMFLLLIFFMVSSTFREHFGIDVTLPEAQTAERADVTTHEITVSQEGQFYFGQRLVDEEGLRRAITDLLADDPEASLVLRADDKADFGRVIRAIDIAREVGGTRLVIPPRYTPDDSLGGR